MYNPITKLIDYLRYLEAVKKAEEAHASNGERYYVMPATMPATAKTGKPKLIIMDRRNFRRLRHKKYINREACVRDLVNECFYCTPYRNGSGYLDTEGRRLKLALYYSYCKDIRKTKGRRHGKVSSLLQRISKEYGKKIGRRP